MYNIVNVFNATKLYIFKRLMVNFMLCKFHINKNKQVIMNRCSSLLPHLGGLLSGPRVLMPLCGPGSGHEAWCQRLAVGEEARERTGGIV